MGRMFIISDTHFNHENIIHYTLRPFKDAQIMNRIMIENWNKVVQPCDVVWHLGDFGIEKRGYDTLAKTLKALNGRKLLVRGNHDYETISKYYEMGFSAVMDSATIEYGNATVLMVHVPLTSHIPSGIDYVMHGHIHNSDAEQAANVKSPERHLNVCVEKTAYKPLLFDRALSKARKRCPKS